MEKILLPKQVEFLVNISYTSDSEFTYQTYSFSTSNKKNLVYAYDHRFVLKRKLDKLYNDNVLKNFESKDNFPDKVVFKYVKQKTPKPKIVNLGFFLPPYKGCNYCIKAIEKDGIIWCDEKKKFYNKGIKNCKIFSSIEEIIT